MSTRMRDGRTDFRDVRERLCAKCAAQLDAALRAAPDATKVEIKVCEQCDAKMAGLPAN